MLQFNGMWIENWFPYRKKEGFPTIPGQKDCNYIIESLSFNVD